MKNTPPVCAVLALLSLQPFVSAQSAGDVGAAKEKPVVQNANPAPAAPDAAAPEESGVKSEEKSDFSGQGKPANKVLSGVAELYNFNVSIPDEVNWPVNESARDMTWQAFFKLVLEKKGYAFHIDNDLVVVEKKKTVLTDNIKKLESGNISVDFDKAPVADVVAAICQVMEKNYSPLPPELEGGAPAAPGQPAAAPKTITIKWKGVSWQKTLSEVLARYDYGFREEEGIIRVLPLKVINDVPSETRVYRVNFADAAKVAEMIKSVFKETGAGVDATKAGQYLTATSESSQQLVVVTAKPDFLRNKENEILAMITQIDQPSKQVVIESKIVERTASNGFDLGFRYAYGPGNGAATGNATTNTNTANSQNVSSSAVTGGILTHTDGTAAPFSMVLSEKDFKFFMDALEQDKTANVLQNPTVVVKDDGQGAIRVIRRVPYFEVTSTQGTGATQLTSTTKFINVGTSMYIKPKIKGNGFVELKIDQAAAGGALTGGGNSELQEGNGGLSISAQDGVATAPALAGNVATSVPITNNRDVRTSVLLRDGYTVALGGLVKDSDNKDNTQIPVLGDIPVLGRLFQSQKTSKEKINLLAFITARISDPYNANYRDQLGLDRVNELGLSSREIESGSYKVSDAERDALTELLHRRDLNSNAAKSADIERARNGGSN